MIPKIDQRTGYLPPGIHPAQWEEIVQRFGTNQHRRQLLVGLRAALINFAQAGGWSILLDGSFVIDKILPNDYDGAWEPYGVDIRLLDPVFRRRNHRAMKVKYGGELFPADARAYADISYRDFFQTDRRGIQKGIIDIDPRELL